MKYSLPFLQKKENENETIKSTPLCKLHKVSKVLLANAMFLILASLETLLFLLTNMVVVTSTAN